MEAIFLSLLLTVIENIVQKDSINFKCQNNATGPAHWNINLFWRCNQMWYSNKSWYANSHLMLCDSHHANCSIHRWHDTYYVFLIIAYMCGITIYCQENIKIECNYSMKIWIFCWLSMQKMLEIVWIEWHFCQERTQRRLNSKDNPCVECVRKLFS